MPASYDVFLCYTAATEPAVEELSHRLAAEGLKPLFEKKTLGSEFLSSITHPVDCSTCALFFGPGGMSEWQRHEIQEMQQHVTQRRGRRFRVIPVLLPGAEPCDLGVLLPGISAAPWVDLRNRLGSEEQFQVLLSAIKSQPREVKGSANKIGDDGIRRPRSHAIPAPVLVGGSAPGSVKRGFTFTARFAAYTRRVEGRAKNLLVGSGGTPLMEKHGIYGGRWRIGTPVMVRVSGSKYLSSRPAEARFAWNGEMNLVGFEMHVSKHAPLGAVSFFFEVFIESIQVASLPLDVKIVRIPLTKKCAIAQGEPARSAFASYAATDRARVADKISAVCAYDSDLDVFLDCLDIKAGEEWKPRIEEEIRRRELFFLFWSTHAMSSQWVDWEWRQALLCKNRSSIRPMPLDSPQEAPPPKELSHLNFNDCFLLVRKASLATSADS